MKNILTGMGQSNVLVTEAIAPILKRLEMGSIQLREYFIFIADVYLKYGKFSSMEERNLFDYKSWTQYPSWWEDEYTSMTEIYKRLNSICKWNNIKKRHMIYIPFGLAYEYNIELANPEWLRTVGLDDYMGKVDFIDHKAKKLYTVKATKNLNAKKLKQQIRDYFELRLEKDYDIIVIWMDTSTWKPFSGNIDCLIEKQDNFYNYEGSMDKPKTFDELLEDLGGK